MPEKQYLYRRLFIYEKIISVILCVCLLAGISAFTACSSAENGNENNSKKLNIVCTIFPEYDWVKEILGDKADNADITLLLGSGVDLHSYQPSASDIVKISECDMFIYVGGESDEWVEDVLSTAGNENMSVINLLDVLGGSVKEEETVEGMQVEDEHEHGHDEEEAEYDEHVWLSLKNAAVFCEYIAQRLSEIDTENGDYYIENSDSYIEKLAELDKEYKKSVDEAEKTTLLFGDRFPFRYLTDDYGLSYYAAFAGCSAETEASFETISFLAGKADELGLNAVISIEGTEHKIAQTIVENTENKNQKVLTLDSMQSTTSKDIKNNASYLSIMQKNLEVLKEALA